jgi:hypothetical protein
MPETEGKPNHKEMGNVGNMGNTSNTSNNGNIEIEAGGEKGKKEIGEVVGNVEKNGFFLSLEGSSLRVKPSGLPADLRKELQERKEEVITFLSSRSHPPSSNHSSPSEVTYAVDAVSGSTGITAPADTILVIDSAIKGKASAVLHVTGRDVPAQELAMNFENSAWALMGEAEEFACTDQRKQVIDLLRSHGPLHPKEIADRTKSSHGAIRKLLFEMRRANMVTQEGGAGSKYTLPAKNQETLPLPASTDEGEVI